MYDYCLIYYYILILNLRIDYLKFTQRFRSIYYQKPPSKIEAFFFVLKGDETKIKIHIIVKPIHLPLESCLLSYLIYIYFDCKVYLCHKKLLS